MGDHLQTEAVGRSYYFLYFKQIFLSQYHSFSLVLKHRKNVHLRNVIQSYTSASHLRARRDIWATLENRRVAPLRRWLHHRRFAQVILAVMKKVKPLQRKPRKNAEAPTGFEPMTSTIPVRCELKQVKSIGASEFFYGLCNCFSCFITARITFTYMVMCILKGFWRLNGAPLYRRWIWSHNICIRPRPHSARGPSPPGM